MTYNVSSGTLNSTIPYCHCRFLPHTGPMSCKIGPIHFLVPDGVKGDLNQALVSLGLALHMLVVLINCSLGFFCVVIWL